MKKYNLNWVNKIPLTLLVASQSFNVGLWNYKELVKVLDPSLEWLALAICIVMGIALDSTIVSVALGKTKQTLWSWATLVVLFIGTSAITLALYDQNWLHVFYAAGCLLYSLHLLFGRSVDVASEALAYSCDSCGATLKNKQAKASSVHLGYCANCKK